MRRNKILPLGTIEHGVFRRIANTATMHKLVGGITDVAITFTGVIPLLAIIILRTQANLGVSRFGRDGMLALDLRS